MSFPISQAFCNLIPAPAPSGESGHWSAGGSLGCGWISGGGRVHQWQWRPPGAAAEGTVMLGAQRSVRSGSPYSLSWEVTNWLFCVFLRLHLAIPSTENYFLVVFIPTDLHPPRKAHREGARFPKYHSAVGSWSRHCGGRLGS